EHYIVTQLWQEGFELGFIFVLQTLVWVHLPSLSLEVLTNSFLCRIGKKVGQLVRVNPMTTNMEKGVTMLEPLSMPTYLKNYSRSTSYHTA
ncbi:hypothetical protein LINPERPRIM_LOCUS39287, partial [Linum perenne]